MTTEETTTFEMVVVKVNETQHWNADFLAKYPVKRIYSVYTAVRSVAHYLCEITPSYECKFLEYQYEADWDYDAPDFEQLRDEFEEELRLNYLDDPYRYYHCSLVEQWIAKPIEQGSLPVDGKHGGYVYHCEADTLVEAVDEVRELACNSRL